MDFIPDLPYDEAQPWEVEEQGPFVAIKQWDGEGETQHWVLIPKTELPKFVKECLKHCPNFFGELYEKV